jgi:hypothetical protein
MADLEQALEHASMLGDRDAVLEVKRFLGVTSVNLGRAALECGDPAMAIAFARSWLGDPEYGEAAETLIGDALESDDLDPLRLAELSLESGRVTPAVVTLLIDAALAEVPPDLASIERALAAAHVALPADWSLGEETIEPLLSSARAALGRAVMRGGADARDFPTLMSVHSR